MQHCDKQNIKNIESLLRSDKMKELAINNGVTLSVNTSYHTTDYATTYLIVEPINPESNIANFMMDIKSSLVDKIGIPISYRYNSPTVRSLVISYNADSLSKIKGEQVKKRDEQGDFDSIAVKEGVDNIFKENSELSKIGTQEQYSQYLDTIFPDSKVKDIVYRGGNITKEEFENSEHTPTDYMDLGSGLYLSPNIDFAKNYGKPRATIVNIKNPKDTTIAHQERIEYGQKEGNYGIPQLDSEGKYDGIVDLSQEFNKTYELVVFEPEQIHILSSKKDLEMFKNFINFTKSEYVQHGDIQQFKDYIMSKNFAAVEEFLVVNNKIDRKC